MKYPKVLGPTITTGTSEIDLGGTGARLKAPCNGSIIGIIVQAARAGIPTVAESDTIVVRLKGSAGGIKVEPFEVFAQPINAGISTDIMGFKEKAPVIPVNVPCNLGAELQITAAELVTCTVHPYVAVTVIFADFVATPQYHAKVGTHTAGKAAATGETVMTTAMRLVAGHSIKIINALFADTTIASGKGEIMKFRLSSSGFPLGDVEFAGEFIPGVLAGATGSSINRLTELKDLDIPIKDPIDIDVYHNQIVALGAAGYFNMCLIYT
jgi:hypothetical protein